MKQPPNPHYRHRFPAEIISHAVWLYHVFSLSLRDVELLLAERGITVSYETVRRWCRKFAQSFAQSFLSAHAFIHGHFHPRRHLMAATAYRTIRSEAFNVWRQETSVPHAP